MTRAAIYCRFSPRPDEATSESNSNQLADLLALAQRQGFTATDADCFSDSALSGGDWDRPGLWDAVRSLKRGDVLLALNVERLARDSAILGIVLGEVLARGATIQTLENGVLRLDDPVSKFLATILGAYAELQRSTNSQRSRQAVKRKLAAGRLNGYPSNRPLPYGYRWIDQATGSVEEADDEKETLELIKALLASGMNAGQVATDLNAAGLTYRGRPWNRQHVRHAQGSKPRRRKVKMPEL